MNFSYGIIAIVGILAAISIGFIVMDPGDVIEPRIVDAEERPTACTMQWDPMCGVDGETYGNMCMLDAADVKLDYQGECVDAPISVTSYIMPKTAIAGETLLVEVEFRDDDKNIIDHVNYDISATQNGDSILSEPGSHRHPGMHTIHETAILDESSVEILVVIQGLGHGEDITEPKGIESTISIIPESVTEAPLMDLPINDGEEPALEEPIEEPVVELEPTMKMPAPGVTGVEEMIVESTPEPQSSTAIVSVPVGSAVPGCEETNECYLPYQVTISSGSSVSWVNDDSAAHTVTSGTVTAGVTGVFDSSLFMSGATFEHTFDDAGTFDYFCMVHPWMTGKVIVN